MAIEDTPVIFQLMTTPFLNVPAALLLTLFLFALAFWADRRRPDSERSSGASFKAKFLVGALLPALLTPVLIGLALLLGTLGMKERPGSEFFEQALFLTLISVGALFYSAVLLLDDRLMRRGFVRFKRDALLVGAVAPVLLFLLNLAAAGPIASTLFEAVM